MFNKVRVDFTKLYYAFPVIMVSFYDEFGNPNIATMSSSFSLDDRVCLGFGSGGFAINTITKVKDFVVNVPDTNLMEQIEVCGYTSGKEVNKFALTGLTPVPSDAVNAPMIGECPVSIECTLQGVIEGSAEGITIITASIKGRQISPALLNEEEAFEPSMFEPVLFLGDNYRRFYGYLDDSRHNALGSFLPTVKSKGTM